MKQLWTIALFGSVVGLALSTMAFAAPKEEKPATADAPKSPLDFTVKDIDGKDANLADLKGRVVMMVNVASKCGNTPQYSALEELYGKYKGKGLVIIGFPANNFGGQEPGSEEEIKQFCSSKYKVTFPMMSKISVKGEDKAPLYDFLTSAETNPKFAGDVKWNFGKFLVGRDGSVVGRFEPGTKPNDPQVVEAVEKALAAKAPKKEKASKKG
jgi:glutathione peroxidase